jgi:hypothetical protein
MASDPNGTEDVGLTSLALRLPLQVRLRPGATGSWSASLRSRSDDIHHARLRAVSPLLAKLGKHKTGKSCLYVKRLADLDLAVLIELVSASVNQMKQRSG